MRAICVAGARPNFMKIKPVLAALERRGVEVILVHTGQHYDEAMSATFFDELDLREPDIHLGNGSGSHADQTGRVMIAFEPVVDTYRPDVVVVVGDVNSSMACAIVAAKAGSLVAHVEAGLRSRDWSMPEEVNRVVTDRVSDFLLAPSEDAVANLNDEGYRPDQIHLVGNVMIDTLKANLVRAQSGQVLRELGLAAGGYGLVTLHRPANVDDPVVLRQLLGALDRLAADLPLVFPVHPRTRANIEALMVGGPGAGGLGVHEDIRLLDPLGYLDFLALEAQARIVLTDSGGVQEETTALGVPCLTLRENTERPITVDHGTNVLVGRDPARILDVAHGILRDGITPRCPPLWDGHAADRIADVLAAPAPTTRRRPTDL